jgi:hypothetical protein
MNGGTLSSVGESLTGSWAGNPTWSGNHTFQGTSALNGSTTVGTNTAAAILQINGQVASNRQLTWRTASVNRWQLRCDAGAESGSDKGSGLILQGYTDAGGGKGSLLLFDRQFGVQQFNPYTVTLAGSDVGTPGATMTYSMKSAYTGSTTGATGTIFNRWWVTSDTSNDLSQGLYYSFLADYGPAATGGGRTCLQATMRDAGNLTIAGGGSVTMNALRGQTLVTHQGPGTSSTVQAMNLVSEIFDTATGWGGNTVAQFNMNMSGVGGNNLITRMGLFLGFLADAGTQAGRVDAWIGTSLNPVNNPSGYPAPGMGFRYFMMLGNGGTSIFPLDIFNGEVIGTAPSISLQGGANAIPAQTCLRGMNLSSVNFTDAAWWSPGFKVAGNGTTRIARLQVSAGTNGPTIDAPLQVAAITTIASSGIAFVVGEQVYDGLGGVAIIDTIDGTNHVTAAHYLYPPNVASGDVINVASATVAALASSGQATVTLRNGTYGIAVGDTVTTANSVAGIPGATTVLTFTPSTTACTITLSANLTGNLPIGTMLIFTQTMPAATATFRTGSRNSFVANLSWTAASRLTVGSATVDVVTGQGVAGAAGDTSGHLLIPFVAGTPTGVPANATAGIALRYDTTAHKLWAYDQPAGAWRGVALT